MKLVLLGTGGYHPSDHRQTACLLLPEVGVVLDAGTALYRARGWLETSRLEIFLTHAHLDHVIGLTYLFDVLHEKAVDEVRVFGEVEKLDAIRTRLLHPLLFPATPPCRLLPIQPEHELPGGGRLTHFPLAHPGGVLGFRLDWPGHSLAYVTDTTADADAPYVQQVRDVDLLVHECNFVDGQEELARLTGHSCTTPVAQVARAANAGRLVLVHFNPLSSADDPIGLDAARRVFPDTDLGLDQQVIEF